MNATRRKDLSLLIDQLDEIKRQVENIMEEEQEAYENMPESLQDSERGQKMQEAADAIENATGTLQDTIDYLIEAIEV